MAMTKPKAEQVVNVPSGTISSTTVQGAINEIDVEKASLANLAASSGASLVGANAYQTQDDINNESGSVFKYGAIADGTTDITAQLNTALATSKYVFIPKGSWAINGTVNVGEGQKIFGVGGVFDAVSKNNPSHNVRNFGTVFVMGAVGQFVLSANSYVGSCVIYYPTQDYSITADGGQPDGLSPFVVFPPTFLVSASYGAPVIDDIVYIGGTQIVNSISTNNCEKLRVSRVTGCCTGTAFEVQKALDLIYFTDIHLNPNTCTGEISNVGGNFTNFATKLAKNSIVFSFANNDGVNLNNCFSFASKIFIDIGGTGSSISAVNCAADICHTFLNLRANKKPFGLQFTNCWATPMVWNAIYGGVVSARTPALVYFDTGAVNNEVSMTNVKTYGASGVSQVTGSAPIETVYQSSLVNQNNQILATNCTHLNVQKSLTSGLYYIENTNTSEFFSAKNVIVNEFIWGEKENLVIGGWGEDYGNNWVKVGVSTAKPNMGNDYGGFRVTMAAGGSMINYTDYYQQATVASPGIPNVQSVYLSLLSSYSVLTSVIVTIDILDSSFGYISTVATGTISSFSTRTDLVIPPGDPAGSRKLRIKIENTGGTSAGFSFVCGFAGNTYFPAIAPSPYKIDTDKFVDLADVSYVTTRATLINVVYNTPITSNRTVTCNTTNPMAGDVVKVTRSVNSTGAFSVTVAGIKALSASQWCTVIYTGTVWIVQESGAV